MAKYRDRSSVGRSSVVPHIKDESWRHRHDRRLLVNLKHSEEVRAWCFDRAVTVTITNQGHHWKFQYGGKVAEWWPASAKLVFDKLYRNGIHCHDYGQVLQILATRWKMSLAVLNRGTA